MPKPFRGACLPHCVLALMAGKSAQHCASLHNAAPQVCYGSHSRTDSIHDNMASQTTADFIMPVGTSLFSAITQGEN